ncbi:MAG: hypothetical protein IPO08_22130 [Xanthomonadales bacterium]|nr:hypothetical protein [Xanthomonadales bacterium]
MRDQFYELLKEKIEARGRHEMDRLASGKLDHDRYQSTCGKLAGYTQILDDLKAINKQIAAQDDDLPENVERIHG